MYKYSLDRTSRKFVCPNCGKKTFVRYVDNVSSSYLEEKVGRCDRETKCQYHLKPNGNKPLVNIENVIMTEPEPTFLNFNYVTQSLNVESDNNFILYLKQYFSDDQVSDAIKKYYIGTGNYWNGATVFWQIDENGNVHAGKVMLYDKYTGKRIKKPYSHVNWIHKVYKLKNYVLQQCLFGIHNLKNHKKGNTIFIVESEKTAIVMSMIFPEYLWLATGSKTNFKEKLLKPLKKYSVIVYPDKSEYNDWNKTILQLNKKGYNFKCSQFLEDNCEVEGFDLVDLLLLERKTT